MIIEIGETLGFTIGSLGLVYLAVKFLKGWKQIW